MHDTDDDIGAQMEMPRYVSHKQVWALEIDTISEVADAAGARMLSFRDKGYAKMRAPLEMFSRYVPVPGDFYVQYADGYKSFSPRKAFLEGYTRDGITVSKELSIELDAAIEKEMQDRPASIMSGKRP